VGGLASPAGQGRAGFPFSWVHQRTEKEECCVKTISPQFREQRSLVTRACGAGGRGTAGANIGDRLDSKGQELPLANGRAGRLWCTRPQTKETATLRQAQVCDKSLRGMLQKRRTIADK
jgi:hypothetical protein